MAGINTPTVAEMAAWLEANPEASIFDFEDAFRAEENLDTWSMCQEVWLSQENAPAPCSPDESLPGDVCWGENGRPRFYV